MHPHLEDDIAAIGLNRIKIKFYQNAKSEQKLYLLVEHVGAGKLSIKVDANQISFLANLSANVSLCFGGRKEFELII